MSADFTANVGANNFTYSGPTGVTVSVASGNALIFAVGVPSASAPVTVADNVGNTYVGATGNPFNDSANGWDLFVFWVKSSSGSVTTVTVTEGGGGNNFCAAWGEISGQNGTTFMDVQNGGGGNNAAWTSDPVTTTVSGDLVAAVASESSANTLGNSGGFTNVATLSTTRTIFLAKLVNQAIGTYNPNWTGGGVGGTSFTGAIESAAATGGGPIAWVV